MEVHLEQLCALYTEKNVQFIRISSTIIARLSNLSFGRHNGHEKRIYGAIVDESALVSAANVIYWTIFRLIS